MVRTYQYAADAGTCRRRDVNVEKSSRSGGDDVGVHSLLCRVVDVRRDRHTNPPRTGPERTRIRSAHVDAGADRRAVPPAAWHMDGQVRWADRDVFAADLLRRARLGLELRQPTLAIPAPRVGPRSCRCLLCCGHTVCRPLLFPTERRGFAMGVFGAGTTGAAINMFIAPVLISRYGWQSVPRFYAAALVITAALFWLLSAPDPGAGKCSVSLRQQLAVLRGPACMEVLPVLLHSVWRLHGSVRLDATIFRAGVWFQHCASGAIGCVLFSSRGRAPSSRRMVG